MLLLLLAVLSWHDMIAPVCLDVNTSVNILCQNGGGQQSGSIFFEKMHLALYKRFLSEAKGGPTKYAQISQLSQASQKRLRPAGKVQRLLVPSVVEGNVVVDCPTDRRSLNRLQVANGSELHDALERWLAAEAGVEVVNAPQVPPYVWTVNSMDIQKGTSMTRLRCSEDYYGGPWHDAATFHCVLEDDREMTTPALVKLLFLMDMPEGMAGDGRRKLVLIRWMMPHNPYPHLPEAYKTQAMREALRFLSKETGVRAFKLSPEYPQIVVPEMTDSMIYIEKGYHTVRAGDPDFYWQYPFHQF